MCNALEAIFTTDQKSWGSCTVGWGDKCWCFSVENLFNFEMRVAHLIAQGDTVDAWRHTLDTARPK